MNHDRSLGVMAMFEPILMLGYSRSAAETNGFGY